MWYLVIGTFKKIYIFGCSWYLGFKKPETPHKYSKILKHPKKLKLYLKSNLRNWKYLKFIRIPETYLKKNEILPKTRNYNQNINPKFKRIYIISKTFLKYPNIPMVPTKIRVLWISDRVGSRPEPKHTCPENT